VLQCNNIDFFACCLLKKTCHTGLFSQPNLYHGLKAFMHITIKSRQKPNGETVYVLPAMGLLTPEGERMIPNPNGLKPLVFEDLQEAITASHRAGFDAEHQGQIFPADRERTGSGGNRNAIHRQATLMVDQALEQAFPILLKRLHDKEPLVLIHTIQALGYSQNARAIEPLLSLLGHESSDVRNSLQQAFSFLPLLPTLKTLAATYGRSIVEHRNQEAGQRERLTILKTWDAMAKRHPADQFAPVMSHVLHALEEEQWLIRAAASGIVQTLNERKFRESLEEKPPNG
jgi:HEAT repeats